MPNTLPPGDARFRVLADNIPQLAWIADEKGWIFWYNRRWFEYTGTTLEQMRGWGWKAVHHPDHLDRVVAKISRCFETGTAWEDTFPLRRHDGAWCWFLSRAMPIENAEGKVIGWFGTNTDVTEQRNFEMALREADERKDEFLATLAHELRNPLATVRAALEALELEPEDREAAARTRQVALRQTTHLAALLDDLMDVSRITRGKLTLTLDRVAVGDVLAQAVEMLAHRAPERAFEVSVEPPDLQVRGDRLRLVQLVGNLLSNAVEHSPVDGRITVMARADGETVVLEVRDEGRGIAPENVPHLFDMFRQGRGGARTPRGLGIGLALVRLIAELHGGSAEGHSEGLGQGSVFRVRLPRELSQAPPARAKAEAAAPGASPSARVLVVDDNEDLADLTALRLRARGFEVDVAYGGEEALERIAASGPTVVVLDLGMPDVSGFEVARRIRRAHGDGAPLLIAVSGWAQESDVRMAREAGFDHHLTKPASVAAIEALIGSARGN